MRWLAFACVFGAAHAHARSFVVTANEDMTFTPAQLEIYQGDSVRFVNAGGLHNVRADDGSFTCALDCNLHNAPSSQPWQVSVRFNRVGSIGYYCEQHGDQTSGMRGVVVVVDRILVDGFDAAAPAEW
ncbi:cupredoxin domain-containing protein [Dokdonella fugitiva]|jgi:plastocyanin|uniref:Plastocyanin n=1 Tax=Dokdonella fugitiva TaxID=328517 RepID=A0A4R2IEB1_9GAMM|nr:plastocyanin/azurin family copper-binding protein [Dokdonella fugitiva]MBA8883950.1 plastocyanin [Dokdonella fugitiva]TCO41938.1 plastocyanin [Dokdonella fugitiva]